MEKEAAGPLGPPPRRARFQPAIRNMRGAYRTSFGLMILVFAGWAILDGIRLYYLPENPGGEHADDLAARTNPQFMMTCLGLAAMMALVVLLWIDRPLRRELVLARRGEVAQGLVLAAGKGRRRRSRPWISYTFTTAGGVAVHGRCRIPRSTPAAAREPGAAIEVLYHPRRPKINKARLALDFVEFT